MNNFFNAKRACTWSNYWDLTDQYPCLATEIPFSEPLLLPAG